MAQIHLPQTFNIQCSDPVIAFPEFLQFFRRFTLQFPAKFLGLLQKDRQIADRQAVRIYIHFLCG